MRPVPPVNPLAPVKRRRPSHDFHALARLGNSLTGGAKAGRNSGVEKESGPTCETCLTCGTRLACRAARPCEKTQALTSCHMLAHFRASFKEGRFLDAAMRWSKILDPPVRPVWPVAPVWPVEPLAPVRKYKLTSCHMLARFREQLQGRAISGRSSDVEQESRPTCETCLTCGPRLARGAARPCENTQALTSCHMLARFREQLQGRAISGRSSDVEQESRPTCETCLTCGPRLARGAARPCENTQALTSCHMLARFPKQLQGRAISGLRSEVEQESRPTCETCLACGTRLTRGAARPCEKIQALTSCHMLARFREQLQGRAISGHIRAASRNRSPLKLFPEACKHVTRCEGLCVLTGAKRLHGPDGCHRPDRSHRWVENLAPPQT